MDYPKSMRLQDAERLVAHAKEEDRAREGWRSKRGWSGKAHYVMADGKTACAARPGPRGIKMGELFRCEWKPLDGNDHLCGLCRRTKPRACLCGRCRVDAQRQSRSQEKNR